MRIRGDALDRKAAYKLLTGIVVPRPIAWVSTISRRGITNLAPFSCFTFVSSDPPMIGFNSGRRDGQRKHTAANIAETREFTVNIAQFDQYPELHASAAEYEEDDSEIEALGLASRPGDVVSSHLLTDCPINLECVVDKVVQFGRSGSEFIAGRVELFHIRDGLAIDGKVDSADLRPLMRLAGPVYGSIGEIVRLAKA